MKLPIAIMACLVLAPMAASAQAALRQRIENTGNFIGGLFADDQRAAEIRSLNGKLALKNTQINMSRLDIETWLLEVEQIERRLIELGAVPEAPAAADQPPTLVEPGGLNMDPITSCPLGPSGECIF